mmetsp:Transcript_34391/g.42467  ORF Transcript_34391/g.42467 Transcript_34391/m.42467 type:complete len:105 (+) Transcript_34391:316-630(+)|eukprot:CAMPEP_0170466126 /NCGR_PEP_ID=MMETSP0123-20130129/10209_1 /TAXON_ID=182087 /ORGANISM="Favella ehrenbergii, Strain Fehren 1" /LENGTH=104 /DNA_ID=CAMNT_0010732189 /DNA_START=210 /DNA_END=524 /DNA_ORIENTATION=+
MFVLGPLITSRIRKNYASIVYKQETEETELVKSCLGKLVKANYLGKLIVEPRVKVLHDDATVALWMSLDQTLFVSIATLKLAEADEAKLALLVSHELAHYLMDH